MSRGVYTIICQNVSVSAAQDVLAAYAGAATKLVLHAVDVGAKGQAAVGNYRMRIVRLPATVTVGSGGTAPAPALTDPLDHAARFTARANDTVQATTTGVAVTDHAFEFNPITGYTFAFPERIRPKCDLSEAFSLSLDDAPAAALTVNATLWVEEQ